MSSTLDALDEVLRPEERLLGHVKASAAHSNGTVMFRSVLALTNQRVLEVSTPALSKIGVGKPRASTVSVELSEIAGCDFRKGKLLWKNGGKNLVVVRTAQGERAWATMNAQAGDAFAQKIRTRLA